MIGSKQEKVILPLEVVLQEGLELSRFVQVGTGGDERAAGQPLVEVHVVASVQLVERQLPGPGAYHESLRKFVLSRTLHFG